MKALGGMRTWLLIPALASAIAAGCGKSSIVAENAAKVRREKIELEIQRLGSHAWAGDYYAGDGRGVNTSLVLAPASGFVFEWHGCLGLYDRNYGAVGWTNNRIRLSFAFENKRKGFQGIASELIPVAWGAREYLVPGDDVVGFCNNVNGGWEPRTGARGFYLLRKGDERISVSGLPKVPDEYRQYLLGKAIQARIIAVGAYTTRPSVADWKFKDTPVTIDAGTKQGLRVGMELVITKPANLVESVRLTKVDETLSKGIITQTGEEQEDPKVGWEVSTRAPWNEPRSDE